MPTPELDQTQIDSMRVRLEQQRDELETLLQSGASAAAPVALDQQAVGRVSRIDAIQQQQMALASREQASRSLRRIDAALKRISEGEYGFCLDCGEPIAFGRLEVQPFATLCVDCQQASEGR